MNSLAINETVMAKSEDDFWAAYRDPRWQRRRLEILSQSNFACMECDAKDVTLKVHHRLLVKNRKPWEYSDSELVCLCETCHKSLTAQLKELRKIAGKLGSGVSAVLGFAKAIYHEYTAFIPEEYAEPETLTLKNHEEVVGFCHAVFRPQFLNWMTDCFIQGIGPNPLTFENVQSAIQFAFESYAQFLAKSDSKVSFEPSRAFFDCETRHAWESPLSIAAEKELLDE